jgi:hypothetical protein
VTAPAGRVVFDLALSAEEYLRHYRGLAASVRVRARNGQVVQFPAGLLRSFVTPGGVHGSFELRFDAHNRLLGLERLAGDP